MQLDGRKINDRVLRESLRISWLSVIRVSSSVLIMGTLIIHIGGKLVSWFGSGI